MDLAGSERVKKSGVEGAQLKDESHAGKGRRRSWNFRLVEKDGVNESTGSCFAFFGGKRKWIDPVSALCSLNRLTTNEKDLMWLPKHETCGTWKVVLRDIFFARQHYISCKLEFQKYAQLQDVLEVAASLEQMHAIRLSIDLRIILRLFQSSHGNEGFASAAER